MTDPTQHFPVVQLEQVSCRQSLDVSMLVRSRVSLTCLVIFGQHAGREAVFPKLNPSRQCVVTLASSMMIVALIVFAS